MAREGYQLFNRKVGRPLATMGDRAEREDLGASYSRDMSRDSTGVEFFSAPTFLVGGFDRDALKSYHNHNGS